LNKRKVTVPSNSENVHEKNLELDRHKGKVEEHKRRPKHPVGFESGPVVGSNVVSDVGKSALVQKCLHCVKHRNHN